MGLWRAWAVVVSVGALAVATSGCGIDKADEQAQQLDAIGDVVIHTTFCTSGDADRTSHACAPYERAHRGQALVAYRIPEGSEAPEAFDSDHGTLHFTRSASYAAFMQAKHGREGMHWVGYVSEPYAFGAGGQAAYTVSPRLTLPDAGAPFDGPYRYTVAGGYRTLPGDADDGSVPVDCPGDPDTDCVSAGAVGDDSEMATRDLGVLGGGEEPVAEAGGSVAVPFDVRYVGAAVGAAGRFSLSASTDLGGGMVALSQGAIEPASDSRNPVAAVVSVPAGAEPGEYEVTLTATAPGGSDVVIFKAGGARVARAEAPGDRTQRRAGVMRFRVVAAQRQDDPAAVEPAPEGVRPPEPAVSATPSVEPAGPAPAAPVVSAAPRALLGLSLSALPRRAYNGDYASYLVVASNRSVHFARGMRVCETLPGRVQFVEASLKVRFAGRRICFRRTRLGAGGSLAALVYVHVDTDARSGMARARASATARNADRVRARAHLRVLRRAATPRRAPVTG